MSNDFNLIRTPQPLLIGSGKLAKHLHHYFTLKSISHFYWDQPRNLNQDFQNLLAETDTVWILVSDSATAGIQAQVVPMAAHRKLVFIHSSAANACPGAMTAHPLQTFGPELYDLSTYSKIPFNFIKEEWEAVPESIHHFFRLLGNPGQLIPTDHRVLYHVYSSMIANFPQILWASLFKEMKANQFSPELFMPLLTQACTNFQKHQEGALTGPLVRGDLATIQKHEAALQNSKLRTIYQNFVELYHLTFKETP